MVTHAPPLVWFDPAVCAAGECSYYTHYLAWVSGSRLSHDGYHRLVEAARAHFLSCSGSVVRQTPACPTCERWVGRLRW
jgi:hypothetical protein